MGEAYVESYSTLIFFVNGKKVIDADVDPEWTLLHYLRNKLRLCGTKLGCAEGGCGACTVMVSKFNPAKKKITHYSVNACLAPVCSMHGLAVTTVEGIGSTQTRLHPVQQRIALAHGSQCGFCTPGIVMSMYALLRSMPASERPSMKDMEVAFQGNLCRCTGYRPIIEGYRTFTEEWEKSQRMNGLSNGVCGLGDQCCKNKKNAGSSNSVKVNGYENGTETSNDVNRPAALFDPSEFLPYDPSQEPIFPSELQLSRKLDYQNIAFKGPRVTWYRPISLEKLLNLKKTFPQAKIVNGNTEIGVEVKFKNFLYPVIIHPNQICEMTEIVDTDRSIIVGAAVTLSDFQFELEKRISKLPDFKTKIFQEITKMLHWFAGKQIRNVGVVGGNIMTGSPISDLNPIFMASNCRLHLQSEDNGKRIVTMDENFWTGYRRNIVKPEEVLTHIEIPHTQKNHFFRAYKQSKRREDDIAIVNAAFNLILDDDHRTVNSLIMAYGGMAPTTVIATETGHLASGKKWNKDLLENIYQSLVKELPLDPGAPGGMIRYRQSLTLSLFFKFFVEVSNTKSRIISPENETLTPFNGTEVNDYFTEPENVSAKDSFSSAEPKSSQYYQMVPDSQEKTDLVGRPIVHQSAFKQATGEAKYCDDVPRQENELYIALVTSTRPHAHIINIDSSKALAEKGVHAFFSCEDIDEGLNYFGHIIPDETVFAHRKVTSIGQIIGAVAAENQLIAQRAAKLVKVEYEDIQPTIITIEDAIREKSYFFEPKTIIKGDLEAAFAKADHILSGEIRMGGQEHFYLETQACVVIPKNEDNELEVICSSQHPTDLQMVIAHMLNLPGNRIVVKVKRMGGGFGGKETRSITLALPCAFAAHKLRRPVRSMLDRDEDFLITGQRHPFLGRYKVAFESSGKITGIEMKLYNNGGHTLDMSTPVMERAMFHMESCYYIPNVVCYGYTCRTNTVSNTAFRGFGGPQGMFMGEVMIRQVAEYLKVDHLKLMELNMYREGQITHFNQKLDYCTLDRCWNECIRDSDLYTRRKEVEEFNRKNRWRKRGIAIVPTKFGISFTTLFLNQAGALVLIYMDGSVLISHGGTEMGQGLHTKMMQVASRALGVSIDLIHISETATDKVPNTSATAASSGSDLNGMAILNACEILNERLKPYKEADPKGTWKDWINKAFHDRVCLSAAGFYKTPDIGYNFQTNKGTAFNYFTYGAACSEVEIDCLTGDHLVRRTDIVMDLGESLNPAIDIGQIEGAFMQGYGLFTIEEMLHSPAGLPYTRGPGAYKIPGFADIPAEFNVSLLKGAPNPRAVYSSKAVGEPPLFLASSIYFAIYEAVKSAREERGITGYFRFDSPATCARIRMACWDEITQKIPEPAEGSYKPWNVVI